MEKLKAEIIVEAGNEAAIKFIDEKLQTFKKENDYVLSRENLIQALTYFWATGSFDFRKNLIGLLTSTKEM